MFFTKTQFYKKHSHPIDNYKTWKDGNRIFGNNKTWVGFFSMIIISTTIHILTGLCIDALGLSYISDLYLISKNTIIYNTAIGIMSGFIYMIAELPNSFIKRRVGIEAGKTDKGLKGLIFFIVDQIDSLVGIAILFCIISKISAVKAIQYIILGAITHICINLILYVLKIRQNI